MLLLDEINLAWLVSLTRSEVPDAMFLGLILDGITELELTAAKYFSNANISLLGVIWIGTCTSGSDWDSHRSPLAKYNTFIKGLYIL